MSSFLNPGQKATVTLTAGHTLKFFVFRDAEATVRAVSGLPGAPYLVGLYTDTGETTIGPFSTGCVLTVDAAQQDIEYDSGASPAVTGYGATGSPGASSGGGGGGDDITAVTLDGSGRIATYTQSGVVWTVTYLTAAADSDIDFETVALSAADDLQATYNYSGSHTYMSGNVRKGGAVSMTWAQAKALADEVLVSAGAAAIGFRALVTNLGAITSTAGVSTTTGCTLTWNGVWWSGRIRYETYQSANYTGPGTSGTLATLILPAGILNKYGKVVTELECKQATGASLAGTIQPQIYMNGGNISSGTSSSGNRNQANVRQEVRNMGSASAQFWFQRTLNTTGLGLTSDFGGDTLVTATINSDTTDLTFTYALTTTDAEQHTLQRAMMEAVL